MLIVVLFCTFGLTIAENGYHYPKPSIPFLDEPPPPGACELDWEEFKSTFQKTYADQTEETYRQQIFLQNQQIIVAHNVLYEQGLETYFMCVNKFGDWLHTEYLAINGLDLSKNEPATDVESDSPHESLPASDLHSSSDSYASFGSSDSHSSSGSSGSHSSSYGPDEGYSYDSHSTNENELDGFQLETDGNEQTKSDNGDQQAGTYGQEESSGRSAPAAANGERAENSASGNAANSTSGNAANTASGNAANPASGNAANSASKSANDGQSPASKDWRNDGAVTPVKDQLKCASCWAFSATGALEGQFFLKNGILNSLSEQQLVDCSRRLGNNGCNTGFMTNAFLYTQRDGIVPEEDYPYEAKDSKCRAAKTEMKNQRFKTIPKGNEGELLKAVGNIGPIAVGLDGTHPQFQFYSDGVYFNKACNPNRISHAVLAIGYDFDEKTGLDYWIIKNSYGTTWGQGGFGKVARNKNNHCGIANLASYPIV